MTIVEKEQQIINDFLLFENNWEAKYEYIIDIGKALPLIHAKYKTEQYLVKGCQSNVWINAECVEGKMQFYADSDAIITKGLISLIIEVLNQQTKEDIINAKLEFLNTIGLIEHLSPTRANGILSMITKIKQLCLH